MRIIYIDIDSLRPDHLGCYGYGRPTSPVIDELAANGVRFTNCHTSDAPCLPSRAALFSGRFGINNGVTCHNGPASQLRYAGCGHSHDPTRPMWMRVLQQAGWETVCFSGFGQRHMAWWFFAGFTQHFGNQLPGGRESAEDVANKAIGWLDANGASDDWFMHVNFWDVHTPYAAPERYYEQMRGRPAPVHPSADQVAFDAEHNYGPRSARDWWLHMPGWTNDQQRRQVRMPVGNPDTYERYLGFLDGYDAGMAYVDEQVGRLLETLERLGVREETAVIVSADHGESIGELGVYFDHCNCCEGTTHVPLIVDWPGMPGGQAHDGLIYQLDLAPAILDFLGVPIPTGWDGVSLAPAVQGESFAGRDHLILGTGIFSFQRAVRTPHHRLIRTIHPGLYPYDPLYLFDMEADPGQRHNLATERTDVVADLDHRLLDWLWTYTIGPAAVTDPFQDQLAAGVDPDLYCSRRHMEQRLIDLGRDDQLADLRRRRDLTRAPRPWDGLPA